MAWALVTFGALSASAMANVDVVVNVSDNPDPAIAGAPLTYTITANNNGSDPTTGGVSLSVALPASVTFVSAVPSDGTVCGAPVGGVTTCVLNNIAAGATTTVPVIVRPQSVGTSTLSATTTTAGDSDTTNNTAISQSTTVFAGADLSIGIVPSTDPVTPGVEYSYALTVGNGGPQGTSTTIRVANTLPVGTSFVSASGVGWTCNQSGGIVTCDRSAALGNGVSAPAITINVIPIGSSGSVLIDSATVTLQAGSGGEAVDPNADNNTATASVTVAPGTDMAVAISANPTTVLHNGSSNFTATPSFVGGTPPGGGSTQTVTIPIDPAKWTNVTSLSGGAFWNCGFAANTVTCTHTGAIAAPGNLQAITWTAQAVNPGAGDVPDTVTATIAIGPETDPNAANNSRSVNMTIKPLTADLGLVKSKLSPAGAAAVGDTVRFRLRVSNAGPAASTGTLTVTDTLPPELRDLSASASGTGWTCAQDAGFMANGIITCTRTTAIGAGVNADITLTTKVVSTGAGNPASATLINTAGIACSGGCLPDGNPGNDSGSAQIVVTLTGASADLTVVSIVANPDPVQAGDLLTYTVTVSNISAVTATDVVVTNNIGNYVGALTAVWTNTNNAPGATTGNCTGSPNFSCSIGKLAQNETATVILTLRPGVATLTRGNTATVYANDVGDADLTSAGHENTRTITSVVIADADVQALMTSTGTLVAGTPLTYTLTARNNGPSAAVGVTLATMPLPADIDLVSLDPACSFDAGTRVVSCAPGAMSNGQVSDYTLVVRPRTPGALDLSLAAASSTNAGAGGVADRNLTNQTATLNRVITPPTLDLLINDTDAPDPVPLGMSAVHTVRVTNQGPSTASNTVISDTPPVGLTIAPPTTGTVYNNLSSCSGTVVKTFTCTGSASISCNVGDLHAGHSACIDIGMTTPVAGVYTNSASVTSTETVAGYETSTANNAVTENTTFKQPADLSLTKSVNKLNAATGDAVVFTLTINNAGPGNATGVTVRDQLPAGYAYVSSSATRGAYNNATGIWTVGNLDNGQNGVLTINVTVNAAGALVNSAEITTSSLPDPDSTPDNNVPGEDDQDSATVTRSSQPLSSIAGQVYFDANDNGAVDGGESGIGGVAMTLTGYSFGPDGIDNNGAGDDVAITPVGVLTDAGGGYSFGGLLPGRYTVTETQPALYGDGRETAGSVGGSVDNTGFSPAAAHNRIGNIVLTENAGAGTTATGYLFGERSGAPASVSGKAWINTIVRDKTQDSGEPGAASWKVELLQNGAVVSTTTTAADGSYSFPSVTPGTGYEIRFRHPVSNIIYGTPLSQDPGYTASTLDYSHNTISNLVLNAGANVVEQNLPIDPSGVVYDAISRVPVSGAVVSINGPAGFDPAAHLVGGAGSQSQITDGTGIYQFLLLPGAPAGTYTLGVTPPGTYQPAPSTLIPPCTNTLVVGAVPNPSLVQSSNTAPAAGVPAHVPAACPGIVGGGSNSTQYFFSFDLGPGSADVLNNHIPLDPILGGAIAMTKVTPMLNVARGEMVPYTVTATNTLAAALGNVNVVDQIPPGFRYRTGSATLNGVPMEPTVNGRELVWPAQNFAASERKTWRLILVVGAGVSENIYTNYAWSLNSITSSRISNIASAAVRVVPDPNFDCSDIIGKVFDDKNANGYQDDGEPGIANVRMATARGYLITSDAEGRFHVTCADVPQMDRGSNFVMKLDERTLPSGYRMTTENPRDVRLTRGKMVKLNFGATVHKVVRVELNGAAFEGDELQPKWRDRMRDVVQQLQGRPSVLRIAYAQSRAEREANDGLANSRLDAVAAAFKALWKETDRDGKQQPLVIETELESAK